MKKLIIILFLAGATIGAQAQTTNDAITEHDAAVKTKDANIKTNIIDPAVKDAGGQAPDWTALTETITKKYDATTADRTITKGKIFFYYYKDWPTFCANIVHYTNSYELANDYKLLNGNAGMILKNSSDPTQLKEAQKWAKLAMDGDKSNAAYPTTYQAITDKLSGK